MEAAPFFLFAFAQRRDPQGAQAGTDWQEGALTIELRLTPIIKLRLTLIELRLTPSLSYASPQEIRLTPNIHILLDTFKKILSRYCSQQVRSEIPNLPSNICDK